MKTPRFSQKTLDFLALAHKQKDVRWLEKKQGEYEKVVLEPMQALCLKVSTVLELEFTNYKFKKRNIGNIKRPANRIQDKGPFKDFLTFSADRDSGSRFEELPGFYFMISPRAGEIFSAAGLYMASHSQIKKMRNWIDAEPEKIDKLFKDKRFAKIYQDFGEDHKLKTKPRDYPLDHPRLEWLKLTGFYVSRSIPKKELFSADFADLLIRDWRQGLRFNELLDHCLTQGPAQKLQKPLNQPKFGLHAFDWDD